MGGKATMADGLPKEVDDVLCELQIVSKLPPYSKLNVRTMTYAYVGDLVSMASNKLVRYKNGENGETTVKYLNGLITRAISTTRKYPAYRNEIIPRLQACIQTINSLQSVYENDKQTVICAKLENLTIRLQSDRIEQELVKQKDDFGLYRPIQSFADRSKTQGADSIPKASSATSNFGDSPGHPQGVEEAGGSSVPWTVDGATE